METTDQDLEALESMWASDDDSSKKKKKGKAKKEKKEDIKKEEPEQDVKEAVEDKEAGGQNGDTVDDDAAVPRVKTAAEKKKEKKEREVQKKKENKAKQQVAPKVAKEEKPDPVANNEIEDASNKDDPVEKSVKDKENEQTEESATSTVVAEDTAEGGAELTAAQKKKLKKKQKEQEKKKTGKEKEEEKPAPKKGGIAKLIKQQQERLREEEERLKREEEEEERRLEEARLAREEQKRLEQERKDRKKAKEKERRQRLKDEGKLLTSKQKQDRRRAEQMLAERGILEAAAAGEEQPTEKKKKPMYQKLKKPKNQVVTPSEEEKPLPGTTSDDQGKKENEAEQEDAEDWDALADNWEDAEEVIAKRKTEEEEEDEESESDEEDDEEDDDEEEDSEESATEEPVQVETPTSTKRRSSEVVEEDMDPKKRALERMEARKEECEAARRTDNLRAPIVCVLGHVDTGKTSILDKLRKTHVQDGEAGGITQQIGATNVPMEGIKNATKMVKSFQQMETLLPGLLIIDTPGHESFANLRSRGSSLCDIAILVVDIMHGIENQTAESINLLKKRKTPFVIALNKIDRIYEWRTNPHADVVNTLKKQSVITQNEFKQRVQALVAEFAVHELNVTLFHENRNPREYVSMVPTSAHSGDGMGNLLAHICELAQKQLAKRLSFSEELEATVMEVKEITGLGTTVDVALVNGRLYEGDTVVLAGQEGPIVTQVRALLMPQPMKELRVKNAYEKHKEVQGAQGIKLSAKDLEKALAGLPLYRSKDPYEIEIYKDRVSSQLRRALKSIQVSDSGVYVQASTLGSLEALLEFLRTEKISYCGINIGPVHKRDVMKASVMVERDPQFAVILAFDVKVEKEAQEMADTWKPHKIKIFTADIIYHLKDAFLQYREDLKKANRDKFKDIAVFPCKLRVMPQNVFNTRDPIVCGVSVEAGQLRMGTPIAVPSQGDLYLGRVTSIEVNHKTVDKARRGEEVCIKIEPPGGDAPKMYGRHFEHTDLLISRISRDSIDAVKEHFMEEMTKDDWKLVIELKKAFMVT